MVTIGITVAVAALLSAHRSTTLHWSPYSPLHAPSVDFVMVAVFALLALPALATGPRPTAEHVRASAPAPAAEPVPVGAAWER
jgi:hypothetical protein